MHVLRQSALRLVTLAYVVATPVIARAARLAFVSSEADADVVVVDLDAEKVVKTLPTGQVPHAMAVTPGGRIFVNNRGSKELTVIDAASLTVTDTVPLPATSFQLATSPNGKLIAVAYKDALKLSLVDPSTSAVVKTFDVGGAPDPSFKGVMMRHPYWSPDGKFVYVGDAVHKVIVRVRVEGPPAMDVIRTESVDHYLHPSPDGKLLYAVNEQRGDGTSVTLINPATNQIVNDLPLPLAKDETASGHHGAFTRDGRFFLFCNEGGHRVSVLDVAKRQWVKSIDTGNGPGHAALSPDGRYFFVLHHRDRIITVIDSAKLDVVKRIPVGEHDKQSHAAWFTPDGKFFYVAASGDGALVKIDVATMAVASRIPIGGRSFFFAIEDGGSFPATEY